MVKKCNKNGKNVNKILQKCYKIAFKPIKVLNRFKWKDKKYTNYITLTKK